MCYTHVGQALSLFVRGLYSFSIEEKTGLIIAQSAETIGSPHNLTESQAINNPLIV